MSSGGVAGYRNELISLEINALTRSLQLCLLCLQRFTQPVGQEPIVFRKLCTTLSNESSADLPTAASIQFLVQPFLPCLEHAESLSYIHLPPTLLSAPLSKIRLKLSLYETALVLFCHWRKATLFRVPQISIVLVQSNPMSQACLGR